MGTKAQQDNGIAGEPSQLPTADAQVKPSAAPFKMPSAEALANARAKRKEQGTNNLIPVGTVLGLPEGFVAAKMDPALDEGRKAQLRAKWTSQGWVELDGLQQVIGYPLGAHVFVKRERDWQEDRRDRDRSIRDMGRNGLMITGTN
jgi:hypothetical protein